MDFFSRNKNLVLGAAAVVLVFAIVNFLDMRNNAWSGYNTDPSNVVTLVRDGSPAAAAGFQLGDRVLQSDGIEMTDSKALSRRPRAEIGDVREYVVERDGEQVTLSMTYAPVPGNQRTLGMIGWLTGVFFLVLGVWAFHKSQNRHSGLFAFIGIAWALLFVGTPYVESYALRTALTAITFPVALFGLAGVLHLMLDFPDANAWLSKANSMRTLYLGPALVTLMVLFLILVQPDGTSMLNTVVNIVFGLFIVVYFGLSLVVMFRNWSGASPDDRSRFGLTVLLVGVTVGLLIPLLSTVYGLFAPGSPFPGSDYVGLAFILLPLAMAYAVMRSPLAQPAEG